MTAHGRRAARVLCVDAGGAVLLVGGSDPARPGAPTVWLPPGGGLEASETDPEAARRELFEETGLWLDDLGPPVARRSVEFAFAGRVHVQSEAWFAVRTARFDPVPAGWSDWERRCLRGLRWWSPGEPVDGELPADLRRLAGRAHDVLPVEPVRPTVRVLVVDAAQRCLLMAAATRDGRTVWFPPGGGLEPGETPVDAARRELREELGLRDADLGPCVWVRRHVLDGAVDLRERWHLLRVPSLVPDVSGWTEQERVEVSGLRWWTMGEMSRTTDLLVPRDLVRLLPGLLADHAAGRLPSAPVEVGL